MEQDYFTAQHLAIDAEGVVGKCKVSLIIVGKSMMG
jgi:hypothetical protein